MLVRVDGDRDAVRPVADDRTGERELKPPHPRVAEDLPQGTAGLTELVA
jgi:hypothetical protein